MRGRLAGIIFVTAALTVAVILYIADFLTVAPPTVSAAVQNGTAGALVLAFASHPLYPAYANLAHRPGGISALADQQIAGGVMLGPGSLAATLYVFIGLYRWLGEDERRPAQPRQYA